MELDPNDIILIYRKRWEIELLFKQLKQNFPLRYFYGESENAIKTQILDYLDSQLTALWCVEEAASDPSPMPLFREWGLELKNHASTP